MKSLFLFSLSFAALTGIFVISTAPVLAQSVGGSVQVGANGPVATFNSSLPAPPQSNFNFSAPQSTAARSASSSAANSQGTTGVYGRQSQTSVGNYYGDTNRSPNHNISPTTGAAVRTQQRQSLTSTFSVNPMSYPSGRWNYGFRTGWTNYIGGARGLLQRGWYLPITSTSSVDLDIVDP